MRGRAIVQWRFGSPPRLSSGNSGTDPTHHLCYPSTLAPIGGVPVIKPGIRSSNDTDKWGRPPSGALGLVVWAISRLHSLSQNGRAVAARRIGPSTATCSSVYGCLVDRTFGRCPYPPASEGLPDVLLTATGATRIFHSTTTETYHTVLIVAPRAQTDALRGSLDLLILKTLSLAPMHGWGVSQRVQQISGGVLQVNQGSLYPALQRLEKGGLITSDWRMTDNNRRARYYRLTAAGRRALGSELDSWRRFAAGLDAVLRTT